MLYGRTVRGASCGDKIAEQALGKRVAGHALGVPLHPHHPMGVAGPLDTLDGAVACVGGHPQILARLVNRLMMPKG